MTMRLVGVLCYKVLHTGIGCALAAWSWRGNEGKASPLGSGR